MIQIQLQNTVSRNWITIKNVPDIGLIIQQSLDELKRRYPDSAVRATNNGVLVNMIP